LLFALMLAMLLRLLLLVLLLLLLLLRLRPTLVSYASIGPRSYVSVCASERVTAAVAIPQIELLTVA